MLIEGIGLLELAGACWSLLELAGACWSLLPLYHSSSQ